MTAATSGAGRRRTVIGFPSSWSSACARRRVRNSSIIYRISAIDLVEDGATGEEIDRLARRVEAAGADILNTGIGWHEARVPTIAYPIPRAAWRFAAARLKRRRRHSRGRVQSHQHARCGRGDPRGGRQRSGVDGAADAGRPAFREEGAGRQCRRDQCLHRLQPGLPRSDLFGSQRHLPGQSACLPRDRVRRRAGAQSRARSRWSAPGAGGLAAAAEASRRGHKVTLFEATDRIGGQINLARAVPGKSEFDEMLRYYSGQIRDGGVDLRLNASPCAQDDLAGAV